MFYPVANKCTSEDQILDPATQGLQGGVGRVGPQFGNLAVEEGGVDGIQFLTHNNVAFDSFLEVD